MRNYLRRLPMNLSHALFLCCCMGCSLGMRAQGIEGLYVETYYISGAADFDSTDWTPLQVGTVTYRVFVDLALGWKVQALYGSQTHPLEISTTTHFYNDPLNDEARGEMIDARHITDGHAVLDSWISLGSGTSKHLVVPKMQDTDGSLFSGRGAKEMLGNRSEDRFSGINEADGLVGGSPASVSKIGADLNCFQGKGNGSSLRLTNGAIAAIEGVRGLMDSNHVLLGQFTTDGELTLELNLQLIRPDGVSEQYVARDPIGSEVRCEFLRWKGTHLENNNTDNH